MPTLSELSLLRVLMCESIPVDQLPHTFRSVIGAHRRALKGMDLGRVHEYGSKWLIMTKMASAVKKAPCKWSRDMLDRSLRSSMYLCAMALGDPDLLERYLSVDNARYSLEAFHILPNSKLYLDYDAFKRELEMHLCGKYRCLQWS